MSSRSERRALAHRQALDIDRAVGRSGVLAFRIWRAAADAARSNKVHGATAVRVKKFDPELVQAAKDELVDMMCFSFLLRRKLDKRRRRAAKAIKLASEVHTLVQKYADDFELDLGKLKAKFEPVADDALSESFSDIRKVMNEALVEATRSGAPTGEATDMVLSALQQHGITARSNAYVERLVRTHAAIAYGAAQRVSNKADLDIWGYEYVTVGDDRVRPSHDRLDGTIRKADDKFWSKFWPPNGWNCRCQAIPIYDDEESQTPVPKDAEPDEGFDFDPADLVEN